MVKCTLIVDLKISPLFVHVIRILACSLINLRGVDLSADNTISLGLMPSKNAIHSPCSWKQIFWCDGQS